MIIELKLIEVISDNEFQTPPFTLYRSISSMESVAIGLIGDFVAKEPSSKALETLQNLIWCAEDTVRKRPNAYNPLVCHI